MAEAQVAAPETAPPPPPEEAPAIPEAMDADEAVNLLNNLGFEAEDAPEAPADEPHPSVRNLQPSPLSEEVLKEAKDEQESPPEEPEKAAEDDDTASVLKEPPSSDDEDEQVASEDEDLPPLDPPRTLDKKQRAIFNSLPPEVQQRWADIEETESREIRRLQTEFDEKNRTLDATLSEAQQSKAQYDAALPQVLGMLTNEYASKFPDIKTQDDVQRMAASNPQRYVQWDALVKQQNAVQADLAAAEQKKTEELSTRFSRYVQEQEAKFVSENPEWGDPEVAPGLQRQAAELMEDKGFSKDEILQLWEFGQPLSARDARFQSMIAELVDLRGKYRKAQTALDRGRRAKVPQLVKPGTPATKADAASADLEGLQQKLAKSGRPEDAVAILAARGG